MKITLLNLFAILSILSCSQKHIEPDLIKLDLKDGNYLPEIELIFNLSGKYVILKSIEVGKVLPPPLDENDFRSDHNFIDKNRSLVDSIKKITAIQTMVISLNKKEITSIQDNLKDFDSLDFKSSRRYNYGFESEMFLLYSLKKYYTINLEKPTARQKKLIEQLINIVMNNKI